MKLNKPFSGGLSSLLQAEWQLELLSPMHIRGNQYAFLKNKHEGHKGRLTELDLCYLYDTQEKIRKNSNEAYSQVTDFNYEFAVKNDSIEIQHNIPASSIRGALRGATLQSYIPPGCRNKFDPVAKKGLEEPNSMNSFRNRKRNWLNHNCNGAAFSRFSAARLMFRKMKKICCSPGRGVCAWKRRLITTMPGVIYL